MLIKATNEQVRKMMALATEASIPMGMGYLHYNPHQQFEPEIFEMSTTGAFIDYCGGRMVKFRMRNHGDGVWDAPDTISADYESWVCKYPSYLHLARAVGAEEAHE